jgi:hypothetical protein
MRLPDQEDLMQPAATPPLITLADFQRDMRTGYLDGAPGIFTSGTVWAVATAVCLWRTPLDAVWTLFCGGVLIHPLAALLTRALGRSGKHTAGNPLGPLALATTIWMILMLVLAYGIALWRIDLFFPAMLFVIGGRYLCFATLFGTRLFWLLGAALALAGYGLGTTHAAPAAGALAGAVIEIAFAALILANGRRNARAAGRRTEAA